MKILLALYLMASTLPALSNPLINTFSRAVFVANGSGAPLATSALIPNDEYYEEQLVSLSHINGLNKAWEATQGEGTTIAIIDSGLDYNHPDFFDEKGNSKVLLDNARYYAHGYIVSSSYGYTLTNSNYSSIYFKTDSTYKIGGKSYDGKDLILPSSNSDNDAHGTNVTGVAAAATSNYGILGIAPKAKILPIKIDMYLDSVEYALKYIYYLNTDNISTNDVDVVNISIQAATGWSKIEDEAKKLKEIGTIVVASAGNSGSDSSCYPAAYPSIIGVGALKENNSTELADYSNYNRIISDDLLYRYYNVDVVAPGTVYTTTINDSYKKISGTSFASPIVAGAALLWKSLNKTGTYDDFVSALHSNAIDLGDEGWDKYFGYGSLSLEGMINVNDIVSPTSISIETDSTTVYVNKTLQLVANTLPESDADKGVDFISNNPEIATVTRGGLVTGVSAGTATIVATSKVNSDIYSSIEITVDDSYIGVEKMEFSNLIEDDFIDIVIGTELDLGFTVYPENATNIEYEIEIESPLYIDIEEDDCFEITDDLKLRAYNDDELYITLTPVDNPNAAVMYGVKINYPKDRQEVHFLSARYTGDTVYVGDEFDYSKIVVTGYYCSINHEETNREVTEWTHTNIDTSTPGKKTITITYKNGIIERQAKVTINVVEKIPTLLSIRAEYVGRTIYVNSIVDKDYINVYATYDIVEEKKVTDFTCSTLYASNVGEMSIIITYQGKTCTLTVNVLERPSPVIPDHGNDTPTNTSNGCGGSLITSSLIVMTLSVVGIGLLSLKKKRG